MSALAHEHGAINLSQGFPNFKGDQLLFDLVTKAMNAGYNQYAPMPGSFALRKAIANKFELLYDTTYHPEDEITVTAGATQAIFTAITALIKAGDEVIVFRPAYDCYVPTIELNGGKAVSIQLHHPEYRVDWAEVELKINAKTKLIIINSPHNPSGSIFTYNDMLSLQKITENTNIVVLSDEVYEHIIFDDELHHSVCRFQDLKSRSFITASFGKTFHNTGWKTGYCCAPKALMDEFRKVHQFNVFSVNHPVQVALAEYLEKPDHYRQLSGFYQEKRDMFIKLIEGSRFDFYPAKGTYFQTVDFSGISDEDDLSFARRLTVEKGVAAIPNSAFNENGFDQHTIRFCFAKTDETLKKAAEILQQV